MEKDDCAPSYRRHRFPPEIIMHAVWLYWRFALSYRDVEELLAERGVIVTYEANRQWCRNFGRTYANELRRRRPRPGDEWHLDEVFVSINGVQQYLWRAVDQDGNVLDILVLLRRDKRTATKFLRTLLKGLCSVPRVVITDKLACYGVAKRGTCRASSIGSTNGATIGPRIPISPHASVSGGCGGSRAQATPNGSPPPSARPPATAANSRQTRAERFATWRTITRTSAMA